MAMLATEMCTWNNWGCLHLHILPSNSWRTYFDGKYLRDPTLDIHFGSLPALRLSRASTISLSFFHPEVAEVCNPLTMLTTVMVIYCLSYKCQFDVTTSKPMMKTTIQISSGHTMSFNDALMYT